MWAPSPYRIKFQYNFQFNIFILQKSSKRCLIFPFSVTSLQFLRNEPICRANYILNQTFNTFGSLSITQSNIYDGAFIVKIASCLVYSQKCLNVDARLGSKYASAFLKAHQTFHFLKLFNIIRILLSVISLKYFSSFKGTVMQII